MLIKAGRPDKFVSESVFSRYNLITALRTKAAEILNTGAAKNIVL